jgi:hypothetical protein
LSTIVQIADAVVAALNAGAFAEPFTAERLFQPVFELADMQRLHVSVVPRSIATQGATRGAGFFDYAVDVGIQRKLDTDTPEEIESLLAFVEEIADYLRTTRLEDASGATWLKTENVPVYSSEHLDQLRQFTSVLTVTYRVMR